MLPLDATLENPCLDFPKQRVLLRPFRQRLHLLAFLTEPELSGPAMEFLSGHRQPPKCFLPVFRAGEKLDSVATLGVVEALNRQTARKANARRGLRVGGA